MNIAEKHIFRQLPTFLAWVAQFLLTIRTNCEHVEDNLGFLIELDLLYQEVLLMENLVSKYIENKN